MKSATQREPKVSFGVRACLVALLVLGIVCFAVDVRRLVNPHASDRDRIKVERLLVSIRNGQASVRGTHSRMISEGSPSGEHAYVIASELSRELATDADIIISVSVGASEDTAALFAEKIAQQLLDRGYRATLALKEWPADE